MWNPLFGFCAPLSRETSNVVTLIAVRTTVIDYYSCICCHTLVLLPWLLLPHLAVPLLPGRQLGHLQGALVPFAHSGLRAGEIYGVQLLGRVVLAPEVAFRPSISGHAAANQQSLWHDSSLRSAQFTNVSTTADMVWMLVMTISARQQGHQQGG